MPAHKFVAVADVCVGIVVHLWENGEGPPLTNAVAEPSHKPGQLTFVCVDVALNAAGSVIVTVPVDVHEAPSTTVTVYVPGQSPETVAVVIPPGCHM